MQPGNIVEYIDRQKILCAVVLEVKNQRLRLLTENTREVAISPHRLSHKSDLLLDASLGRDAMTQVLRETAERRNALTAAVDIRGLWEVLKTEQEWIDLATMTAFVFQDTPDSDHESAVVRAFFKNRLYFKFNTDAFFPYTEDQVRQAKNRAEREARTKRLVSEGVTLLKSVLAAPKSVSAATLTGDRREVVEILKASYLFGKESESYAVAKMILSGADIKDPEEIFRVMVKTGEWNENENLDLYYHRVPSTFSEEVLEQISAIADQASSGCPDESGRRDLTDLPLLTIDGPSTLDFDDALSIVDGGDHYLLGIHISDVGAHIRKGDAIDQEALSRGSSIYLPDMKIPMIPATLSENRCSLVAGEPRPAISTQVKISPTGKILGYEIFSSIVKVRRQLTYTDATLLAESDAEIALLQAIARQFRRRRLEDGAVHISLPEVLIQFEADGTPKVFRIERESASRMLISELMILANMVTAEFLAENRMPAVFRSQPNPRERLYQGDNGSLFQNWMQRKALSRFVLGTRGQRHSGLGLDAYVTATSPIRKYYDLVTQRQVRAVLGLEPPYTEEEIAALLQRLDHPMSYVPKLQYRRTRYWLLKHLESRIGQKEEAIVLGKRKNGYQILLPAYMVECFMPLSGSVKLKPEDYIQITFQHVKARRDDLSVFMA